MSESPPFILGELVRELGAVCAVFLCGGAHCLDPLSRTFTEACPSAVSNEGIYETNELPCCDVIDLRLLTDVDLSAASECVPPIDGEIGLPIGPPTGIFVLVARSLFA